MDFAMARAQCKIVCYSEEEYVRQLDAVKAKTEKQAEKTSAKVLSTAQYFNSNEGKIDPGPYLDRVAQARQQIQYASRFDQVTQICASIDAIWKGFIGDARKIGCEAEQQVRETNLKIKIMKTQTEKVRQVVDRINGIEAPQEVWVATSEYSAFLRSHKVCSSEDTVDGVKLNIADNIRVLRDLQASCESRGVAEMFPVQEFIKFETLCSQTLLRVKDIKMVVPFMNKYRKQLRIFFLLVPEYEQALKIDMDYLCKTIQNSKQAVFDLEVSYKKQGILIADIVKPFETAVNRLLAQSQQAKAFYVIADIRARVEALVAETKAKITEYEVSFRRQQKEAQALRGFIKDKMDVIHQIIDESVVIPPPAQPWFQKMPY